MADSEREDYEEWRAPEGDDESREGGDESREGGDESREGGDESREGGDESREGEDPSPPAGKGDRENISDTTAPSVGPNTTIEREPPEVRLAKHEQSDVDAMGLDKRREIVGGSYGPSMAKQVTLYGTALAIMAALVIGFILLAGELDKPPESYEDQAPWSQPEAPQTPPSALQ